MYLNIIDIGVVKINKEKMKVMMIGGMKNEEMNVMI